MVSSTSSNPWNVTASTIDLEEVDLETPEADGASAASPTGSPKAAPKSSKSLGTLALDASASASVSSKRDSTMSAASEASAASRASVAPSDVTFEEVGFDDAEAWTEGPGARLDRDLALDLGLATPSGSPVKHLASIPAINTGSASASVSPSSSRPGLPRSGSGTPTSSGRRSSASPGASSPAASERTVLGGMLRESVSSATSAYSSYSAFSGYTAGSGGTGVAAGAGLGLSVREGDIPLVLGVAVVDFNHLVSY